MPTISLPRPLVTFLQSVVAKDDTRPALAGFHLTHNDGLVNIYAADGFVAGRAIFEIENMEIGEIDVVLEARPLFRAIKAIDRYHEPEIRYDGDPKSSFAWSFGSYGSATWTNTRVIDGKYPDLATLFAGYDADAYSDQQYGIGTGYLAQVTRVAKALKCPGVLFKPTGSNTAAIVNYPNEYGIQITTAIMPIVISDDTRYTKSLPS